MNKTKLALTLVLCLSIITSLFVMTPGAVDDRAIWENY